MSNEGSRERKVEALFLQHYDLMFKAARKVLRNTADAEDVVQALFLKFVQFGLREEVLNDPRGYLRRSAVNASLDFIDSRKSRKETHGVEKLELREPRSGRADENVGRKLEDLFGSLRQEVADVLLLHSQHGYSDAEIAIMTGVAFKDRFDSEPGTDEAARRNR